LPRLSSIVIPFLVALCLTDPAHAAASAACIIARPPDSLWSLARCCAKDLASDPGCRSVSRSGHFIILKDNSPAKPAGYLIIPTMRVSGIEDPQIFALPVADFWAYGWRQAQAYVGKPAADTALAINSQFGRTQNQLHIHISCVRPDVAQALAGRAAKIGDDPAAPLTIPLGPRRHRYRVVGAASLVAPGPFALAAAMPGARRDMAAQSIAVIGSQHPGLFYVLDTYHHPGNPGAAEELLDQTCQR
jgi:CDP-diacylglycerol pyrophosphatase